MESTDLTAQRRKSHGILKMPSDVGHQHLLNDKEHIKFDEEIIAEHDKTRGTRQKITEPKTPYAQDEPEENEEQADTNTGEGSEDVHMQDHTTVHVEGGLVVDEEIKRHLDEAEKNKQLNA